MPCNDSSSRMVLRLDGDEHVRSIEFNKVTCGKPIGRESSLAAYCAGRGLAEIAEGHAGEICLELGLQEEEERFLFHLEWEALQAAIGRYTGEDEEIDAGRFQVASIVHDADGVEITLVIHPPPTLPPITPCNG